jgi:hypothetical protein
LDPFVVDELLVVELDPLVDPGLSAIARFASTMVPAASLPAGVS